MAARRKRMRQRGGLDEEVKRENFGRDWAGLPGSLLEVVLERLPLGDSLSFSRVCKSWRIVAAELFRGRACGIPWLVKPRQKYNISRTCFSILEDVCYEIEFPEAYGTYIWGSFEEWLVVVKPSNESFIEICLLNPFLRSKILLRRTYDEYRMMVLSAIPSNENYVCMLIGREFGLLAFWKPGAPVWLSKDIDEELFEDALSYKGYFYLLNYDFSIVKIDVENVMDTLNRQGTAAEIKTHLLPVKMLDEATMTKPAVRYLVESCGEILLVCRYLIFEPVSHETCGFGIYRLDLCHMTWIKLESLGDQILFIGKFCSRSFPAKELGDGMTDCIYYTYSGVSLQFNEWNVSWRDSDVADWGISA